MYSTIIYLVYPRPLTFQNLGDTTIKSKTIITIDSKIFLLVESIPRGRLILYIKPPNTAPGAAVLNYTFESTAVLVISNNTAVHGRTKSSTVPRGTFQSII